MADSSVKIDEKHAVQEQLKQAATNAEHKAEAQEPKAAPAPAPAKPVEKKEADEEKPKKVVAERVATIPFTRAYKTQMSNRAKIASATLREYAAQHMKVEPAQVRINPLVNALINKTGSRHPPRTLKLVMRKLDDGTVTVAQPDAPKAPVKPKPAPKATPKKEAKPKVEAKPKAPAKAAAPAAKK